MTWLTFHRQSEALAQNAHESLRAGNIDVARRLFSQAAALERQALDSVAPDKSKTRGITAVSAAALYYKAGEFDSACQLAYHQLGGSALPAFARAQLEELVQTVYNEREKEKYDVSFLPGMVNVSVKGGDVLRGAAPLDLIVDRVKTIQAMFFRVIEWTTARPHRKGPPTKDVSQLFQSWLLQDVPGSFQFSVAIKASTQLEMFEKQNPGASDVARQFLNIVQTISTDETGDATKVLISDDAYRTTFRKLVRNLSPTGREFESLEFRSAGVEDAPRINAIARTKIAKVIRAEQPAPVAGETSVELTGNLRAVDLNDDWLKIHVPDQGEERVSGVSQQVDDVIGPMVNRQVLVRAVRGKFGSLRFIDIELIAEPNRRGVDG
ncbi:hypothetical protein [Trinickia acidisoli]|uniref:hypothetical protein n=1 Tax=Trinickia acidisoli TaxID=2767482 RepID=UPI001A8E32A4|nr:hypothetical protein [Trinickia acidisoli]